MPILATTFAAGILLLVMLGVWPHGPISRDDRARVVGPVPAETAPSARQAPPAAPSSAAPVRSMADHDPDLRLEPGSAARAGGTGFDATNPRAGAVAVMEEGPASTTQDASARVTERGNGGVSGGAKSMPPHHTRETRMPGSIRSTRDADLANNGPAAAKQGAAFAESSATILANGEHAAEARVGRAGAGTPFSIGSGRRAGHRFAPDGQAAVDDPLAARGEPQRAAVLDPPRGGSRAASVSGSAGSTGSAGATDSPGTTASAPATRSGEATGSAGAAGSGTIRGTVSDEAGRPVAYAVVMVRFTGWDAISREDGSFEIARVAPGSYTIETSRIGYEPARHEGVVVEAGVTTICDLRLRSKPASTLPEMEVSAHREVIRKKSTANGHAGGSAGPSSQQLTEVVRFKAGIVARGDQLHFRGGRSGEVAYQIEGVPHGAGKVSGVAPARPPVVNTAGGSTLPNDEPFDTMFFRHYGVNPFIPTDEDSLSTFAVDVDNASYTLARRYIELGHLPPPEAVRVEEFVNYFEQGYPEFTDGDFRIFVDGAPSPFGPGYVLLRVGIKARQVPDDRRKPANLTFVIDVSGSMAREDRLELVKRSLGLLVEELRDGDQIGIVVYSTRARYLLNPVALGARLPAEYAGRDQEEAEAVDISTGRRRILEAIEQLAPEQSTNAEEGLALGYDMASSMYRPGSINRIILCTDGVANEGATGAESILARVRREADRGIYLSAIGFGMGNYNDVLLERLADEADGNYYYVDDPDEAKRVLVENLTGTLQVVARDAKVQVEFDPARVLRYRLLGFENRDVADRDFRNDQVDAGEIGAGHEVTALYEVKLARGVEAGRVATVRLRYARPDAAPAREGGASGNDVGEVREISHAFDAARLVRRFEDAAPHLRLDAAVAEFAEVLRGSYWAKGGSIEAAADLAREAARDLGAAWEFADLAEKAANLGTMVDCGPDRGSIARPRPPEGSPEPAQPGGSPGLPDWERRQERWRDER